jgi:hypothetical protein
MIKNQKIVAVSYTKQRTMFGLVGIEVDPLKKIAYVGMAKQWKRDDMNSIPGDIARYFAKVPWDLTFADQQVGQHMIRSIEKSLGFEVATVTNQKNLKDPEDIELVKVIDMTEMTQLTLSLKQEHKIQFPPINELTSHMEQLTKQIEMFTEHVTEAGTVSYFAPGEELDCLPRALMICLFVARTSLQHGELPMIIRQGNPRPKTIRESEDEFLDKVLGGTTSLSTHDLNSMDRKALYQRKRFDF